MSLKPPPARTAPAIAADGAAPSRGTLRLSAGRSATENRAVTPRARQASGAAAVDTVPLKRLTAGRDAVKIAHAGEMYLLRVTKANKLILTKPKDGDAAIAAATPAGSTGKV